MDKDTQLPAEVKEMLTAEANQYAHNKIGDIQTIPANDVRKWEIAADGYEAGATEYATKLHLVQQENQKLKALIKSVKDQLGACRTYKY